MENVEKHMEAIDSTENAQQDDGIDSTENARQEDGIDSIELADDFLQPSFHDGSSSVLEDPVALFSSSECCSSETTLDNYDYDSMNDEDSDLMVSFTDLLDEDFEFPSKSDENFDNENISIQSAQLEDEKPHATICRDVVIEAPENAGMRVGTFSDNTERIFDDEHLWEMYDNFFHTNESGSWFEWLVPPPLSDDTPCCSSLEPSDPLAGSLTLDGETDSESSYSTSSEDIKAIKLDPTQVKTDPNEDSLFEWFDVPEQIDSQIFKSPALFDWIQFKKELQAKLTNLHNNLMALVNSIPDAMDASVQVGSSVNAGECTISDSSARSNSSIVESDSDKDNKDDSVDAFGWSDYDC